MGVSIVLSRNFEISLLDANKREKARHKVPYGAKLMVEDGAMVKKGLGGNYYATMISRIDRRFSGMLMESVIQGKTQYTEACKLTYTNRVTFSKLAERMAI